MSEKLPNENNDPDLSLTIGIFVATITLIFFFPV